MIHAVKTTCSYQDIFMRDHTQIHLLRTMILSSYLINLCPLEICGFEGSTDYVDLFRAALLHDFVSQYDGTYKNTTENIAELSTYLQDKSNLMKGSLSLEDFNRAIKIIQYKDSETVNSIYSLADALHDADSIDIVRVGIEFDSSYLKLPKILDHNSLQLFKEDLPALLNWVTKTNYDYSNRGIESIFILLFEEFERSMLTCSLKYHTTSTQL